MAEHYIKLFYFMLSTHLFGVLILVSDADTTSNRKRLVLHSDSDIAQAIATMSLQMTALESNFQNVTSVLKQENELLKVKIATLEAKQNTTHGSGAVYVRWGRNTCPVDTELVYRGYTGGKHYNVLGSGSDTLCLPFDPTWSNFTDVTSDWGRASIYGAEIDIEVPNHIFDYDVNNQDMPCAVCRSAKSTTVLIPARGNCYQGWTLEYSGYLMAGMNNRNGAYNHICMDQKPEFVPHGGGNDNQHILYLVGVKCGSLPCPPYVEGRELPCVVCSR